MSNGEVVQVLDIAEVKENVEVEVQKRPYGLIVLYVHIDGLTRLRVSCLGKKLTVTNQE